MRSREEERGDHAATKAERKKENSKNRDAEIIDRKVETDV